MSAPPPRVRAPLPPPLTLSLVGILLAACEPTPIPDPSEAPSPTQALGTPTVEPGTSPEQSQGPSPTSAQDSSTPGGETPTPDNSTDPSGPTPTPGGPTPTPGGPTPTPGGPTPTPGGPTPTPGEDTPPPDTPTPPLATPTLGEESCDGADNDQDGQVDEGVSTTLYADVDGDGYGDAGEAQVGCAGDEGLVPNNTDCNDADAGVNPAAEGDECLEGVDYNCDDAIGVFVAGGGTLNVDVPVVRINFTVTLGGAAISGSNTSDVDYGGLELEHVETGKRFPLQDLFDVNAGAARGTFTAQVAPGVYHIYYSVREDGPRWPSNEDALLRSSVAFTTDGSLALDIPIVTVDFTAQLAGAAVTSNNTTSKDHGTFALVDATTGDRFPLWSTWDKPNKAPVPTYSARLIPGTYSVVYERGAAGDRWPQNEDAVLLTGRTWTSNATQTVNVPTVTATLNVTLNGAAISSANSGADDEAEISLRDAVSRDTFKVFSTWDDGDDAPPDPRVIVVPGTYDVLYDIADDGPKWPANRGHVLKSGLALTSNVTTTVDVRTVPVELNVTLGGQTTSASNTHKDDEGAIHLRDTATGEIFLVMSTWNDTADIANGTETLTVIPGTYDLYYANHDRGTRWPYNQRHLLRSAVAMTSSTKVAVDVPVVYGSLAATLGGAPVTASNTGEFDFGVLELEGPTRGDDILALETFNGTSVVDEADLALIPGEYQVVYRVGEDGPSWPGNDRTELDAFLNANGIFAQTVDVPYSTVTFKVTLDGAALSSSNTGLDDEGAVVLHNYASSNSFEAFSTWSDTFNTLQANQAVRMLPASYELRYSVNDDGPSWPSNRELPLGCFSTR